MQALHDPARRNARRPACGRRVTTASRHRDRFRGWTASMPGSVFLTRCRGGPRRGWTSRAAVGAHEVPRDRAAISEACGDSLARVGRSPRRNRSRPRPSSAAPRPSGEAHPRTGLVGCWRHDGAARDLAHLRGSPCPAMSVFQRVGLRRRSSRPRPFRRRNRAHQRPCQRQLARERQRSPRTIRISAGRAPHGDVGGSSPRRARKLHVAEV